MRARIIQFCATNLSYRKIAEYVDCAPTTVSNWKKRWKEDNPKNKQELKAWLEDLPRIGAPCRFTIDQRAQVIALACENPSDHGLPITAWTSEELRQMAIKEGILSDISRRHVSRFLAEVDLKPHRIRQWLNSKPDPEKNKKIAEINKAYKQAEDLEKQGVLTFCLDEMTGIQALERIAADKPSKPGKIRCIEYEYKRHGTLCLLGGFNVANGKLVSLVLPRRTELDFVQLVDHIFKLHPKAKDFRFILDNLNTHQSEQLVRYVAQKEGMDMDQLGAKGKSGILSNMKTRQKFLRNKKHKIAFLYTPKHASWMNQIEIVFGVISRKAVRRGSFFSKDHLKQRLSAFIEYFNTRLAKPFKWSYGNKPLTAS